MSEEKPKSNGVLGSLSANAAALIQAGALGLLALFIWFIFMVTRERMQATHEELKEFRAALQQEREHDAAQREHGRRALLDLKADLVRDSKAILDAVADVRAQVRKLNKEEEPPGGPMAGLAAPPASPPDSLGFNLATALARPGGAAWKKAPELAANYEAAADRLASEKTLTVAQASKELSARNAATLGVQAVAWREWLEAWQRRLDSASALDRVSPQHYATACRETAAGLRAGVKGGSGP